MRVTLRTEPNELAALVSQAAAARGIPQAFVEKDFWVTELLRSIASPPIDFMQSDVIRKPRAIFKGGTSLSRAYHLIERFSEDVDILVTPGTLEVESRKLDKVLQLIDKCARPNILEKGAKARVVRGKVGIFSHVEYDYPRQSDTSSLRPHIFLELGVRGGDAPTQQKEIRSMLAEIATEDLHILDDISEFMPFSMEVLAPERTLIEKLSALHSAQPEAMRMLGRHLYDVNALLSSRETTQRLQGHAAELAEDTVQISHLYGWPAEARPEAGFAASRIFTLGSEKNRALRRSYALVAPLVYGHFPAFEDCISNIQAHADIL